MDLGIREPIMNLMLALYSSPTVKAHVNGDLSNAFSLSNGTRQVCPLSPLIFVLTLKPLLIKIRANPDITGVSIAKKNYKLAAFADEILLFLTNLFTTIPNVLKDFSNFKTLTNLQYQFLKNSHPEYLFDTSHDATM